MSDIYWQRKTTKALQRCRLRVSVRLGLLGVLKTIDVECSGEPLLRGHWKHIEGTTWHRRHIEWEDVTGADDKMPKMQMYFTRHLNRDGSINRVDVHVENELKFQIDTTCGLNKTTKASITCNGEETLAESPAKTTVIRVKGPNHESNVEFARHRNPIRKKSQSKWVAGMTHITWVYEGDLDEGTYIYTVALIITAMQIVQSHKTNKNLLDGEDDVESVPDMVSDADAADENR